MNIDKKETGDNRLELTVKVNKAEATPYMIAAAARLSQARNIKGFRPGKAPFEIVKREFGENAIFSEALEDIVDGTLNKVLQDENIRPYGQVGFNILPTTDPEEIVAYQAVIITLPTVELGDWTSKKIKKPEIKISDEELNKALDELASMSAKEEEATRPAEKDDNVLVDFEVRVDGKVIPGGTANDFGVVIGQGRMIPGFEDKLIGAKPSEKLEFKLSFPSDYHAELAGKEANFTVTIKKILARIKPIIDEEFAKKLGLENVGQLKDKIRENLKYEKEQQENERLEIAAVKQVVDSAKIDSIPKEMMADTVKELVHDFEHSLAHKGLTMEQYLKTTSKTLEVISKDFEPKALERIRSSLVLEEVAVAQKFTITTDEIEEELEAQRRHFSQRPEVLDDLGKPEYRRHVANTLLNRKLIKFIKEKIVE